MPVLLGSGLRLFEDGAETVSLAKIGVRELGGRTGLSYRVAG
jgi:hypothetical protein